MATKRWCDKCGVEEFAVGIHNLHDVELDDEHKDGKTEHLLCTKCIWFVNNYIGRKPSQKDKTDYENWQAELAKDAWKHYGND